MNALLYQGFALSLIFLAALPHLDAAAEVDWPEFRGPTGQGISDTTGLPIRWSGTENLTWMQPVPGKGWSSPVYQSGRIYLTTAVALDGDVDGDQSLRALCLNGRTGRILWQREVFTQDGDMAPSIQSKNSHASPTPVLHAGKMYVHFGHQGTACLDFSGNVIWRNQDYHYAPRHGNGGSPIIVDDLLIFSCDGESDPFVVALDRHTGLQRWRTNRNVEGVRLFSFSTPLLIQVQGRPLVISPGSEIVGAYDSQTGKEVWRIRYAGGYSVVPRPVFARGLIFVCSGYDSPTLYAIRPDGVGDVTHTHVAWSTNRGVPHNPSVLVAGNELYMVSDSGVATCLDAKSGKNYWTRRLGGEFSASPMLAKHVIYFQDENGTAHVIEAGRQFKLLATNKLENISGERTFASYAVGDGALFLRSEKHLLRIESQ